MYDMYKVEEIGGGSKTSGIRRGWTRGGSIYAWYISYTMRS